MSILGDSARDGFGGFGSSTILFFIIVFLLLFNGGGLFGFGGYKE